ncbi:YraN family protein [Aliiroseovarius subalbicans]|uniref:YraN family protein n=1 Tax=Aliiroseovarius subalbicans TaxID=2925840 RepID=UPI001F5A3DF2|nr:YraN family protein [Aliiroseovarius subalbicans]MCI2399393.1 YraN family protein [Aliiroseovarius subalbicans]
MTHLTNHLAGQAAEEAVEADYVRRGHRVAARRWRGSRGEIDLVMRSDEGLVFIEVKKSRSFARAAERLSRAQMQRIYGAASEFLAGEPDGQNTALRFDVALLDQSGQMKIIENAIGF